MKCLSSVYIIVLTLAFTLLWNPLITSEGSAFSQNYDSAEPFVQDLINYNYEWNFKNISEWRQYAKVDEDSLELIVGINHELGDAIAVLEKILMKNEAYLVKLLKAGDRPIAAVVDVPLEKVQILVGYLHLAGLSTYIEPNCKVELTITPNDPLWPYQWGPKKIKAHLAWDTEVGDPSVLVAVIDTGIDYTHEDLADNYVALGYDWVNDDENPMDDHGHGTHCAGIIAAVLNNEKGIAGLAQVKIMAEKVLSSGGWGYWDWLAEGIIHAVNSGADVLSMSLGGPFYSKLVHDAIKYASNSGVITIAAAGNDHTSRKIYPAGYDEVIAVSATDKNDNLAYFSNYGGWIELSAPGVDILSTVSEVHHPYFEYPYSNASGTSMACPHVAGVAALALSRFPDKPAIWIREWLRYTVDDLGDTGFDIYYGYGRVNAQNAVEMSPPEHDIIVLGLNVTEFVGINESATVVASIMNFGGSNESSLEIKFFVNDSLQETQIISTLESASITDVSFYTAALARGMYNIAVHVTPLEGEARTNNNIGFARVVADEVIKVPEHFETIQKAVDVARPGDTIFVASGNYSESVYIYKCNLTIYGENRNQTLVYGHFWMFADGIHISNLRANTLSFAFLIYGNNCIIENCTTIVTDGVFTANTENNIIRNNIFEGFFFGISLVNSTNTIVENNYIYEAVFGVVLSGHGTNYVLNNRIINAYYGILFGYGLWMPYAEGNNVLRNNIIEGYYPTLNRTAGIAIVGNELSHFIHDVDMSNIVNGKPACYLVNKKNLQINPSTFPNIAFIVLVNSTNVIVEDFVIEDAGQGVLFAYVSDSIIRNLTCQRCEYGIKLFSTHNVSIVNSQVTTSYGGIRIEQSSESLLRNNTMFDNIWRWNFGVIGEELSHFIHNIDQSNLIDGKPIYYLLNAKDVVVPKNVSYIAVINSTDVLIKKLNLTKNVQGILFVHTCNSRIENVKIYNNTYGIQLIESYDNIIKANHIYRNLFGIELKHSSNNSIYLNNFISYSYDKIEINSINYWHGLWNVTGNFWIDYRGEDINGDGIGDTKIPYNGDSHPLMAPYLPGDVNYNGKIEDSDLDILSSSYGSCPGGSNWNPHADIDEDGMVDILDICIACVNYNKTWTDYWGIELVPLKVQAKDQYGNSLAMMKVWIDGEFVGYTGSTFYVAPDIRHKIYVSSEYTEVLPGEKYVYTFDYWKIQNLMQTEKNPLETVVNYKITLTAYYNRTRYLELKILAKDQYGNSLAMMKVWIDGEFVGYTGSTFYVAEGEHTIKVQDYYERTVSDGKYVYTFDKWSDGFTSNPRTLSIDEATTLTAKYYRRFIPEIPPGPGPGPSPQPLLLIDRFHGT